jgi:hypothetical protein
LKIARHFNAGKGLEKSSPAGTVEKKHRFRSSLRDSMAIPSDPGVQTPGYFQNVPAGHGAFVCTKIEMRPTSSSPKISILLDNRFPQAQSQSYEKG